MSRFSWRNPPACVVLSGNEDLLRIREIRNAVAQTRQTGRPVIWASGEDEVSDALASASTFGESCLIVCPLEAVSIETVRFVKANQPPSTCLLLFHEGVCDEQKFPQMGEVHGGYRISHVKPTSKKGAHSLAVRFARKEAADLLGNKDALAENLADTFIQAIGNDLGLVAFEIAKATAYARFLGQAALSPELLRKVLRGSTELDLSSFREALKFRDSKKLATALDRIQAVSGEESVMLLLRGKGGPADLAVTWLRAALFLRKGGTQNEMSQRLGVPDWSVPDIVVALKIWDVASLRALIRGLSEVDLGVLRGAPNAWHALQSQLLLSCLKGK